jgi:hypothetical protein
MTVARYGTAHVTLRCFIRLAFNLRWPMPTSLTCGMSSIRMARSRPHQVPRDGWLSILRPSSKKLPLISMGRLFPQGTVPSETES